MFRKAPKYEVGDRVYFRTWHKDQQAHYYHSPAPISIRLEPGRIEEVLGKKTYLVRKVYLEGTKYTTSDNVQEVREKNILPRSRKL